MCGSFSSSICVWAKGRGRRREEGRGGGGGGLWRNIFLFSSSNFSLSFPPLSAALARSLFFYSFFLCSDKSFLLLPLGFFFPLSFPSAFSSLFPLSIRASEQFQDFSFPLALSLSFLRWLLLFPSPFLRYFKVKSHGLAKQNLFFWGKKEALKVWKIQKPGSCGIQSKNFFSSCHWCLLILGNPGKVFSLLQLLPVGSKFKGGGCDKK